MTAEMTAEAEALHFERAAQLRDRIAGISALGKRQTVIAGICADTDVWGVYRGAAKCCCAVLHVEEGQLAGRETKLIPAAGGETPEEILSAVTAQYYLPRAILPHEILLPLETEDCEELTGALTQRAGRRVWAHVPQRGEKAELLAMARRNAQEEAERVTTAEERADRTLELLAGMLDLGAPPARLESFDISNTGASDIVASMVVYAGARPDKSAYRRFSIRDVQGHPDDYASMQEVLRRRLARAAEGDEKFLPLPDAFLIDGGVTHAQAAARVAQEFGCTVPIFGMVKDDRHRTRALVTPDGREIGIGAEPSVFALIGRIQEETHRFAVAFHHQRHEKSAVHSALDDIPGVGPARREALRRAFGSIRAIRQADEAALAAAVPKDTAAAVYRRFHPEGGAAPESGK
jgi:excinuclease ABC subunit C